MKKLVKVFGDGKSRISGTGGFPAPKKSDIGREVIVYRQCMTWDGCLGYFKGEPMDRLYAFYNDELG